MKCPVCKDVTLLMAELMAEKNGVEIDYCPECRGIWPDRGELDKIIEHHNHNHHDSSSHHKHSSHKKKSSVLSDILEIFGGE